MSSTEEPTLHSPMTKKALRALWRPSKDNTVAPPVRDEESGLVVRHVATKDMAADMMLKVKDGGTGEYQLYLVNTRILRDVSPYFSILLDPEKFAEGIRLGKKAKEIRMQYRVHDIVPLAELPSITVDDVGHMHAKASTQAAFTLFLGILHGLDITWEQPDWSTLAMLAIIADRFDALQTVRIFIVGRDWTKRSLSWDGKTPLSIKKEELVRQQILVSLLFGIAPLFNKQTATLIVADSILWSNDEESAKLDHDTLWWNLPQGIEGTSANIH